jgi:YD repeat-containing protein
MGCFAIGVYELPSRSLVYAHGLRVKATKTNKNKNRTGMEPYHVPRAAAFHHGIVELYAAMQLAACARHHHSVFKSASRLFALLALVVLWALLLAAWPLPAQAAGAQYFYDWGGRLIQVVAPNGASAQYSYDPAGNLLAVTPISASTAALVGFSNPAGVAGSTITLYGSGFSTTPSSNLVYFNGVAATVVSSTANTLTVVVPSGATTGTIAVTTSHGTVSSASLFDVVTGPSISSFTPALGSTGTVVTVNGSSFVTATSRDAVLFAGVGSAALTATGSVLTTSVPKGASSGKISVATPWGAAYSTNDFFVAPAGYTAANISSTGRIAAGGSPLTASIGTAGNIALVVFDGTAGQGMSLQLTGSTFNACASGDDLFLEGPGPQSVAVPISSASQFGTYASLCNYTDGFILPVSGTYTLVLATDAFDTGSVTMRLQNAPPINASISIGGSPVTVTTTVPAQQAQLTFTTTSANQIVSVEVSGSTFPSGYCGRERLNLIGPAPSTALANWNNLCSSATAWTFPTVGTYTLLVSPYNTDIGSVTIQLQSAPTVIQPISIGGAPVTLTTTVPAQKAQLTFTASSANQRISVQVSGSTYTGSGCFYDSWGLVSPSTNSNILQGNLCTNTYGVTLPVAGTYTINLTPANNDTGSVTFQLQNAPAPATAPLTVGGSAVALTTVPAQLAQFTFATTSANQIVTLEISGSTYPSGCGLTTWQVIGPAPATTLITPSANSTNNVCANADSVALPTAGTYTIIVTPSGSDAGSVTFQLQNPPAPVTVPISIGGPSVTTQQTTVPGQLAQLTFTTTSANQNVSFQILGGTFEPSSCGAPAWQVIGPAPATTLIKSWSDGCLSAYTATLPTVGTYSIVVTPYGIGTITYQLQNAPLVAASISIGGVPVTVTTTVPAQQAQLTFTTTSANQIVSVEVSGSTFTSGCGPTTWQVSGPSPTMSVIAGADVCSNAYAVTFPVAGTYTIVVIPNSFYTGSVTFQLQNAPLVTAPISIGGAPVTVTTTVPAQNAQLTFTTTSANQFVTLQISGSTYPTGCTHSELILNGPAPGTGLISTNNLCPSTSAFTLPTVGSYTLTVTPWSMDTGSVTVQLY